MLYLKWQHVVNLSSKSIGLYLINLIIQSAKFSINSNKLIIFFREGCYIDSLQKLSLNSLLTNLTISSTQFFNMNYLNYKFIKFFIDYVYIFFKHIFMVKADFSFAFILQSLLFFLMFLFQIIILLEIFFSTI